MRGIFENVTKVTAASSATNLGSKHSVTAILDQFDGVASFWLIKTWPTAVRIKFGLALEELGAATAARKGANSVFFKKFARVSAFGTGLAKHVIFELGEFGLPLLVALLYWIVHVAPFVA